MNVGKVHIRFTKSSTDYYPFGQEMPGRTFSADKYRFGMNEQEKDKEVFLGVAMAKFWEYDSRLGRRWNLDPITQINISDYACFSDNPIWNIDIDGNEVIATDEASKQNIKNTLTKKESRFVKFNKDGILDTKRLNKSKSKSENIIALKSLANSDLRYKFKVTDKDDNGEKFYDGSNFYRGITETPNDINNPSPDKDVWILVGNVLSNRQQTKTTAHEAYGHAYFYELQRKDSGINYKHTYKSQSGSEWDAELKINVFISIKIPTNEKLEQQIKKVVQQAEKNYDARYSK